MISYIKKNSFFLYTIILSLLFKIGLLYIFPSDTNPDTPGYTAIAQSIVSGRGYTMGNDIVTFAREPVYPLFIASIYSIFGYNNFYVSFFQILISIIISFNIFIIANKFFGYNTAKISFALSCFYPILAIYSTIILTETIFAFFLSLSILLLIYALQKEYKILFFISGISFGLANLTRPETILLFILTVLLVVLIKTNYMNSLLKGLLIIIGFIVISSPWYIFKYSKSNSIISAQSGGPGPVLWYTAKCALIDGINHEKETTVLNELHYRMTNNSNHEINKILFKEAVIIIVKHPVKQIKYLSKHFIKFWITSHSSIFGISETNSQYLKQKKYILLLIKTTLLLMHILLLGSAIAGIIMSFNKSLQYLIFLLTTFFSSIYILVDTSSRHHVPYLYFLIVFSAFAFYKHIFLRYFNHSN